MLNIDPKKLEVILKFETCLVLKRLSSLPDHFTCLQTKMILKIFFTLEFLAGVASDSRLFFFCEIVWDNFGRDRGDEVSEGSRDSLPPPTPPLVSPVQQVQQQCSSRGAAGEQSALAPCIPSTPLRA